MQINIANSFSKSHVSDALMNRVCTDTLYSVYCNLYSVKRRSDIILSDYVT